MTTDSFGTLRGSGFGLNGQNRAGKRPLNPIKSVVILRAPFDLPRRLVYTPERKTVIERMALGSITQRGANERLCSYGEW